MTPRAEMRGTCARCERKIRRVARWMPDGPLCASCDAKAIRTVSACVKCGVERLTPGLDEQARPLCCPCAGIAGNWHCSRCGKEWRLRSGLCEWCFLSDTLDPLLDGPIDLAALKRRLLEAPRPDSLIIWLYDPAVRDLLTAVAAGPKLSHERLDQLSPPRAVAYLRALIVSVGLLEARDERLARFDRLAATAIQAAAKTHQDVLARFARWQVRASLVAASERKPLSDGQITNGLQKIRVARDFLAWLKSNDASLSNLTQAQVDTWFATPPSTRRHVSVFLTWAKASRECPRRIRIPKEIRGDGRVLAQQDRLHLLQRLLDPNTGPLDHRVAGILLILLGQPYSRMVNLTIDDIATNDDGHVTIRLPGGAVPLPHPFAALFTELAANRPRMNTAANHSCRWLFPGRRADQPVLANTLRIAGIQMGIDLTPAKRSALRQLVMDAPPPVVADMLGYSYQTLDRHAQQAGSRYRSYAAARSSDHN